MKIILSPAKKMREHTDDLAPLGMPVFLEETRQILAWLLELSYADLKKLLACNDRIAGQNFVRFQEMELARALTPAILSYEGIAYQYMAPSVFEEQQFAYVQDHLRILSGFYGVLRPMDAVAPYRLEMQAKAKIGNRKNLYEYWGDKLYQEVTDESGVIVNLASKEYSRCIERYLTEKDTYITCVFGELEGEKIVQKGVYAKMARGEMVRFMAEYEIENPEEMKQFDRLGYQFCAKRSSDREYCFLK